MSNRRSILRVAYATLVVALALVVSAALVGCGAQGATEQPDAGAGTQAASAPLTIQLLEPLEGAVVPAGQVPVNVETTGLTFVMASNTNVPGEGHVHYTLDDRPFIMSITPDAVIEDVEPGEHTLIAELVQNNTESFDPPVIQEITFTAE